MRAYEDNVWSSQEPTETKNNTIFHALAGMAGMAGVVSATAHYGTQPYFNGNSAIDYISVTARGIGNASPYELLNTFRVPEFLSPFTTDKFRAPQKRAGYSSWSADYFKNDSSYEWLKFISNRSDDELANAGINRGMLNRGRPLSSRIEWERNTTSGRGSLYSIINSPAGAQQKILLSDEISLMTAGKETIPFIGERDGRINQALRSIFAASDRYDKVSNFKEEDVFSSTSGKSSFVPIPSITGRVSSLNDLTRRTSMIRGAGAFEMLRFNTLLKDLSRSIGGDFGEKIFNNVLSIRPEVGNATMSKMFFRFGGKAAMVGAGIMGIQQLDWLRRQGSAPTDIAVGGIFSGGLAYAASRVGFSGKTSAMLGIGSFIAQMALPGFDQGLLPGIATTGVNIDVLRGSSLNPFNYQRRIFEGLIPGVSSFEGGLLGSVMAMSLMNFNLPFYGRRGNVFAAEKMGITNVPLNDIVKVNRSIRDIFYENMSAELGNFGDNTHSIKQRLNLLASYAPQDNYLDKMQKINNLWQQATEEFDTNNKNNPLNTALLNELDIISSKHSGANLSDRITKNFAGALKTLQYSFLGADLHSSRAAQKTVKQLGFSGASLIGKLGKSLTVGLGAFLIHGIVTGGFLGSMETSEELSDIYSGKELVEIKKGRMWEAGGTPYEGGANSYFRPHQYHLMMNRITEKGIWGADEDEISPIGKFFRSNFTYDLEKENYWSRPYPITSGAFSNVPIIGGILANTIGAVIKPQRVMHANEWMRENPETGDVEYADVYRGQFMEPSYELGAIGTGIPDTGGSASSLYSDLVYQYRELSGMTGFATNTIQSAIFGSERWHTGRARLAQSGDMTSPRRQFWDLEMGGALLQNEVIRRFLPAESNEIEKYNPLRNMMPSWLPTKFTSGDPYTSIKMGEARLPGPGFEALHPELKGLTAEQYPDVYKYQILADVAPTSNEFFRMKQQLYRRRLAGGTSESENKLIDKTDKYHARLINRLNFDYGHPNAIEIPMISYLTQGAYRTGIHTLLDLVSPVEYMVPMGFRPFSKLLGQNRDAIERYEAEELYGTPLAFWNKPLRDWFRPAFQTILPFDGKPYHVQHAEHVNEYFDKLQFIKYMDLIEQAELEGDKGETFDYKWLASRTRTGINPQAKGMSIYWALPDSQREYFNAFANASASERNRIREMVPEDTLKLYESVWARVDSGDMSLYSQASDIDMSYMNQQYTDAKAYIEQYGMPSPDWIGFSSKVNMDDIKVRYIERIGGDLHDYDMWESDLARSQGQSFLDDSEAPFINYGGDKLSLLRKSVYNSVGNNANINRFGKSNSLVLSMNDNRNSEIQARFTEEY